MNFFANHTPETNYFDCGFTTNHRNTRLYAIGYNRNQVFTWRDFIPCVELSSNGFHFGICLGIFVVGIQILFID